MVPTFNERGNVAALVSQVHEALPGVAWELIFVDDDSSDGTAEVLREIGAQDPRVRCLLRLGRRGLASACTEGMLSSSAPYLAVMDADLQHDPRLLQPMLQALRMGEADVVIGSRYTEGGSVGDWSGLRLGLSHLATRLSIGLLSQPVSDPMSGYFALRREVLAQCATRLSAQGFKILLDILASSPPPLRVKELPFAFGQRLSGQSKLSSGVAGAFLMFVLDKWLGRLVPARFLSFAGIGLLGLGVHFAVLTALFHQLQWGFAWSHAAATGVAISFNYTVNNRVTYAERRLRGGAWLMGLWSFYVVCGLGASANVGMASYLFDHQMPWAWAALVGIVISAVWNYAVSARYTWGVKS